MIKTLRITSLLTAALAVILVGFFVFRIVHGTSGNEKIREFLDSPSVVERFRTAEGNRSKNRAGQSLLVQQAQAFALYLNPPANKPGNLPPGRSTNSVSAQVNVTPKFKVVGISYYEGRPEMSMALIDEPGKGIHWVKQSTMVGHLLIEQVKNDSVIVKGGSETFNLALEREKQEPQKPATSSSSLLKKAPVSANRSRAGAQTSYRQRNLIKRVPQKPQTSTQNAEKKEELEQLYEQLRELKEKSDEDDSGLTEEERAEQIEKIISSFKASYVSPEEAKKLDDLAEQLQDFESEPNSTEIEEEIQ